MPDHQRIGLARDRDALQTPIDKDTCHQLVTWYNEIRIFRLMSSTLVVLVGINKMFSSCQASRLSDISPWSQETTSPNTNACSGVADTNDSSWQVWVEKSLAYWDGSWFLRVKLKFWTQKEHSWHPTWYCRRELIENKIEICFQARRYTLESPICSKI